MIGAGSFALHGHLPTAIALPSSGCKTCSTTHSMCAAPSGELCPMHGGLGFGCAMNRISSGRKASTRCACLFVSWPPPPQNLAAPLRLRCSRYADMAAFRATTRDLEQQLEGVLASAAAQAASLPARLDVIEAFAQTATRDGLR